MKIKKVFKMKRTILFLFLLISLTAFSHEDTYKAVEKSNLHIMIQVGYKSSWELLIMESYAEIINDFIKEIDSTQKVFIRFDEDYCFFYDYLFFVGYGEFTRFIPSGFPWGYKYDMRYINTQEGIGIIINEKYFKLKTLLQLLEFGLQNKNYIIDEEGISKIKRCESETAYIIDSIMQSELSHLTEKYLSKRVDFCNNVSMKWRTEFGIDFFLQNDSILFVNTNGFEILKLSTINSVYYDDSTDCLFLFNANRSFYFINQNLKSDNKQYNLPFEWDCLEAIWVNYVAEESKYKLEKDGKYRVVDKEYNGIDWVYFDEINGITKPK